MWLLAVLCGAVVWEAHTSTLQARYFTAAARGVAFVVEDGASPQVRFPSAGPMDQRLGYTAIPRMVQTLEANGYRVTRQARVTGRFARLVDRGVFPLYREKVQAGLTMRDGTGALFYASPSPSQVYETFDAIPKVVWRSLIFIESRELLDERFPHSNPAVEWDRLARSLMELGLRALGRAGNVPGGSTLATQLEKFRHSPEGRTMTVGDKAAQIVSAALRAYLDGPNTLDAQRRIVRAYLNSVPLAAQQGQGEVIGLADGLWAWYGTPFDEANTVLWGVSARSAADKRTAEILRQALSLIIAQRRPSYYLVQPAGRAELDALTDRYLELLASANVVPQRTAQAARLVRTPLLTRAPERSAAPFVGRKAANQVRTHLLSLLSVPSVYDLDRLDLTVTPTLNMPWQNAVTDFLQRLARRGDVAALRFNVDRLLDRGDPSKVIYAVTLMETTPFGNVVRVQTDTYKGPLSVSDASRVELGSTAKLRTLVTYLEAVAEIHGRLAALEPAARRSVPTAQADVLTRWVRDYLAVRPDAPLAAVLDAAMERRYLADPRERFSTGGGIQTFGNFDSTFDRSVLSVSEAFRLSVNLPLIRVMRDVVNYFIFRLPETPARVLEDPADPGRQEYLARFADREGRGFLREFYRKYRGLGHLAAVDTLLENRGLDRQRMAWAIRTVLPEADVGAVIDILDRHIDDSALSSADVEALVRRAEPAALGLSDLAYLARVHPLELWTVRYLIAHPGAELTDIVDASRETRQEAYRWLFRTNRRDAQDQRIRTILELEAFAEIHQAWRRVGYPFDNIVASFGTAIGSSGDRPLALAELVGIVLNDGIRYPIVRVEALHFAEGTPFETRLVPTQAAGERVMTPEVAAVVRRALVDVVEHGSGRRALGAVTRQGGTPFVIGGKTGTGDNRYRVFGAGGRLLESRPINRTATFAFFIGDRHFGVVTAYVPGGEAADYRFTSALPVEILGRLGPMFELASDGLQHATVLAH